MSKYGEPWLWGYWVRERDPADRKDYYTFCEKLPNGKTGSPELWANVQYGDRVHCSTFGGTMKQRPIIYDSGDYYQGETHDPDLVDRGVICVNACRGIPTELLGRVEHACIADNARMLGLELRPTHLDLLAIAEILRKAGFDVCEPVSAGR
jgi:hypothetical protein